MPQSVPIATVISRKSAH